jgi:hypothetical protein
MAHTALRGEAEFSYKHPDFLNDFSPLYCPSGSGSLNYRAATRIPSTDTTVLGGGHVGCRSTDMRGGECRFLYL